MSLMNRIKENVKRAAETGSSSNPAVEIAIYGVSPLRYIAEHIAELADGPTATEDETDRISTFATLIEYGLKDIEECLKGIDQGEFDFEMPSEGTSPAKA